MAFKKIKNVRKIIALMMSVVILFTVASGLHIANAASGTMTVSSTTYKYGAPVYVTATSSVAEAWVGVYHVNDTPKNVNSIYWYYVNKDGHSSGETVDVRDESKVKYNSTRSEYHGLPEGQYKIYLFESSGYDKVAVTKTITVVSSGSPAAPSYMTYTRTSSEKGIADGTVSVRLNNSEGIASDVVLYWADSNGVPLSGYSALQMQPVPSGATSITFDLVKNTLIPKGAAMLTAYALNSKGMSTGYAAADIDPEISNYNFGTLLAEFQVVSDIHVLAENATVDAAYNKYNNKHFVQMLQDITQVSPDSSGVIVVGDITEYGSADEYKNVAKLYDSVPNAPQMYWTIGNHDFNLRHGDATTYINRFLSNYNEYIEPDVDKVYYDKWIGGVHCIFMGSEANADTAQNGYEGDVNAYVSREQLDWLKTALADGYEKGKPIFVFMHQAIYNTVAGSLAGQGWDGIDKNDMVDGIEPELMALLASYPEALYFSGHSHWELNSISTMFEGTDTMCTAFNTGSVAYLWTSYNNTYSSGSQYVDVLGGTDDTGSQGYYVEVYSDKVLVLGRDFTSGSWLPSAMFCVDFSELTPADTSIESGVVSGGEVASVGAESTVSSVIDTYLSGLNADEVVIYNGDGTEADISGFVATGMTLYVDGTYYDIIVAGDTNCDGMVNIVDAEVLLQYIRTGEELSDVILDAAAAADGKAEINIMTVVAIVNSII